MNNTWLAMLCLGLTACSESVQPEASAQIAAASTLTAGEQTMTSGNMKAQGKTAEQWYQQIKQQIGTAAADDVSQCRIAPLGHKPCGGPASYLVYSVRDLDEPALLAAITQYTALDQAQQQAVGLVSDCAIVPEPVAALQNGVCVALPAHLSAHLTE
jgi:hypothetical protein